MRYENIGKLTDSLTHDLEELRFVLFLSQSCSIFSSSCFAAVSGLRTTKSFRRRLESCAPTALTASTGSFLRVYKDAR